MTSTEIISIVNLQKDYFSSNNKWTNRELKLSEKIIDGFVSIITGVRRSGKSTLLKAHFLQNQNCVYLHFDDPRLSGFEVLDFYKLETHFGPEQLYMFDEVQQIHQWEKYIRQFTERKGKAIVTGSNASLLSKEYGSLLTGRNLAYELFPFSYTEFLSFSKLDVDKNSLNAYMTMGGFPEFVSNPRPEILQHYYSDILGRDIILRHGIRNKEEINKLALYLMNNIARPYSITKLKTILGLNSVSTISSYLSYLEDAYLFFNVSLFDHSYKKQLINNKKIYSIDTGLVIQLTSKLSRDQGRLFENMVFLYLRKKFQNIFYYQDKFECDFIVHDAGQSFHCIQVSMELSTENLDREINGLVEALNYFNLQEGWIITFDQNDEFLRDGKKIHTRAAHAWMTDSSFT